jgi:ABC-type glutathione transport system ATPase component
VLLFNMEALPGSTFVYPVPEHAVLPGSVHHEQSQTPVILGNDSPASQNGLLKPLENKKIHHNASITSSFFEEIGGNRVKEGMCLAFQDVCFTVRYKDPQTKTMIDRKILKNCTGILKPGTLNAIMGASGGGKTSLLDVLADRKNAAGVSGSVFVNGKPRDRSVFMHRSGYVVQVSGLQLHIIHDNLNDNETRTMW